MEQSLVPPEVTEKLKGTVYELIPPRDLSMVLSEMGINTESTFAHFFHRFGGVFGKPNKRWLMDLEDGFPDTILLLTEQVRTAFGFPKNFWVISNVDDSFAFLLYDSQRDCVSTIEDEESLEGFVSGIAKPEWRSFADFLQSYFNDYEISEIEIRRDN